MNRNKILFGLVGIFLGFSIGFFLTQSINRSGAAGNAGTTQSAAAPGSIANQQGMMASVRDAIENAKNNPKDFEAQVNAARMYYDIGRIDEAIEYLKKAYDIKPGNLNVAATIANLYFDQRHYPEAETWYRRSVEIKPDEADLYVELGATLLQRDPPQPDKAIGEIQRALKIDSKNAHALEHLVEAYIVKKDAASAEGTLERLKQAQSNNPKISTLQSLIADLKAGKPVTIPKE